MDDWTDLLDEMQRELQRQQLIRVRIMLISGLVVIIASILILYIYNKRSEKQLERKQKHIRLFLKKRSNATYCTICGGIFDLDHSSVKKCLKLQKKALKRFAKNTIWSFNYQTMQFEKIWG